MAASEAQKRASKKYMAEHLEQVRFSVPRGKLQMIKDVAAARNRSMAQYIIDLIEQDSGMSIRGKDGQP